MDSRREVFRAVVREGSVNDARMHGHLDGFISDHEYEVVFCQVIPHLSRVRRLLPELEDDVRALQPTHRRLIVQIKGADGLDLVIEPLHAQRLLCLPGVEIHDSTTPGKLSALCHHGHTLISRLTQRGDEVLDIQLLPHLDLPSLLFELASRRDGLVQAVGAEEEGAGTGVLFHFRCRPSLQHRHALRRQIRVGQGIVAEALRVPWKVQGG